MIRNIKIIGYVIFEDISPFATVELVSDDQYHIDDDIIRTVVEEFENRGITVDTGGDDTFEEFDLPDGAYPEEARNLVDVMKYLLIALESKLTKAEVSTEAN